MKLISLNICLTVSSIFGAAIVGPGDNVFDSYVNSAQAISASGTNLDLLTRIKEDPNIPFTAEDYNLLIPQIADPDNLGALLVDREIEFDLNGLSVSPDEAKEGLFALSDLFKDAAAQYIKNSVHYKTQKPTHAAAVQRIHASLDRLDEIENLEQVLFDKVSRTLESHPGLVRFVRIAVLALPNVFDHDVLNYFQMYFQVADEYNPEVARTLRKVFQDLEVKYMIFPKDYYNKIRKATPIHHTKNY